MTGLTIAYAASTYCSSCHDLADDNNSFKKAFPHGLSGIEEAATGSDGTLRPAVWLTAGAYAGASRTAVTAYNAVDATNSVGGIIDGVCLKCHRGNGGANGVGIDF